MTLSIGGTEAISASRYAPDIQVEIINSGNAMGGAGEPGTPGIGPALANAIFHATGARLRSGPFSPEKVLKAIRG